MDSSCVLILARNIQRRLIVSETTDKIILEDVDGKCFIRHIAKSSDIEDWIQDDDHYFVSQKKENDLLVRLPRNEFKECICVNERWEQSKQNRLALLRHGPIRALELFAGMISNGPSLNSPPFVDGEKFRGWRSRDWHEHVGVC